MLLHLLPRGARVVLHAKLHVVQHGFPRKDRFRVLLEHEHHLGTRARDRLAVEAHRSGGRLRQPRHDVQQRRFAAARRADHGDEFALADRKADALKRRAGMRRESLFEAIDQKGVSHRRSSSLLFWWKKQSPAGLLKSYAIGNVQCVGEIAIVAPWAWHCGRYIPNMMRNRYLRTAIIPNSLARSESSKNLIPNWGIMKEGVKPIGRFFID